ncbi:MAG: antibiotic biosynthesis monooxygenase [Acidobacteriota bacterium]|nr:antibiotic biosynthesis monooxygenase [Acidobacteriota bacterium]
MSEQAYTLAMYRVKAGKENDFVAAWNELADTFSSLPNPPLWGTLIRHQTDRTLFYSFGPWRSADDVKQMRASDEALKAFARIRELCEELTPGDFEVITHVDVRQRQKH